MKKELCFGIKVKRWTKEFVETSVVTRLNDVISKALWSEFLKEVSFSVNVKTDEGWLWVRVSIDDHEELIGKYTAECRYETTQSISKDILSELRKL